MATYNDNFTDTNGTLIHNHTSDSGDSYGTNSGLEIQSNRLVCTDATTRLTQVTGFTSDSEYTIDLDYYKYTNAGTLGIVFGNSTVTTDVSNGYNLRIHTTGKIQLYTFSSGFPALLGEYNPLESDGTQLDTIRLKVSATDITVDYGATTDVITSSNTAHTRAGPLYIRAIVAATSSTGHHLDAITYQQGIPATSAPTLSGQSVTGVTTTNATVNYTTDVSGDTRYLLFDSVKNQSSAANVKALATISEATTGTGALSRNYTASEGLKDGRKYFAHIAQENTVGLSNLLDTDIFTIPTLSNTYDEGVYSLTGGATAPNGDNDTDAATLNVIDIKPAGANLTFTGQSSTFETALSPNGSAATFAGQVARIEISKPVDAATIGWAGQTPNLHTTNNIVAPSSSLDLTGQTPSVDLAIPTGNSTINLVGQTPIVSVTITQLLPVANGTLTLSSQAPTLATFTLGSIPVVNGTVNLSSQLPTISITADIYIPVDNGALNLSGEAPTLATFSTVSESTTNPVPNSITVVSGYTYNLAQHVNNPTNGSLSYALAAGSLNTGMSLNTSTGLLTASGTTYSTVAGVTVSAIVGTATAPLGPFSLTLSDSLEITNDMIPRLLSTDVHEVTVFKTRGNRFKVVISQDGSPVDLSVFTSFELHGLRATAITSSEAGAIDWADGNGQIFLDVGSLATVSGSVATTLIGFSSEYPEGAILWHPNLAPSHVTVNLIDA